MQMEIATKEIGKMVSEAGKVHIFIIMVINTRGCGLRIAKKAKGLLKWTQEIPILANGKTARSMAGVYIDLVMTTTMKANSLRGCASAKAYTNGQMAVTMKVNGRPIR